MSEKEYAEHLARTFGLLSIKVIDELLAASYSGYDYDSEAEVPYYNEVKRILVEEKFNNTQQVQP